MVDRRRHPPLVARHHALQARCLERGHHPLERPEHGVEVTAHDRAAVAQRGCQRHRLAHPGRRPGGVLQVHVPDLRREVARPAPDPQRDPLDPVDAAELGPARNREPHRAVARQRSPHPDQHARLQEGVVGGRSGHPVHRGKHQLHPREHRSHAGLQPPRTVRVHRHLLQQHDVGVAVPDHGAEALGDAAIVVGAVDVPGQQPQRCRKRSRHRSAAAGHDGGNAGIVARSRVAPRRPQE